jgi:hypothetical protein
VQERNPLDALTLRNEIATIFARLKDRRGIAPRHDRCPIPVLSACALAAIVMYW